MTADTTPGRTRSGGSPLDPAPARRLVAPRCGASPAAAGPRSLSPGRVG